MSGFTLFCYLLAVSLSCMALAFGVAANASRKAKWGPWYLVFQSCLVFSMVVGFCNTVAYSLLSEPVYRTIAFIFPILSTLSMSLILCALPYFVLFLVSKLDDRKPFYVFIAVSALYIGLGTAGSLTGMAKLFGLIQTAVFVLVFSFCVVVLYMNFRKIDDSRLRLVCKVVVITAIALIPTAVVAEFFPVLKRLVYPVYAVAMSVVMMVYYINRFSRDGKDLSQSVELTMESLSKYHITEREFQVIMQVCAGKSNKEIARDMAISVNTVNNHVANIFSKMNLSSRMDLLRMVRTTGPWA